MWFFTSERDFVWMCSDFYVAINAITQRHNLSLTLPFSSLFIAHNHKGRFCFTGHAANKPCAPQMSTSVSCRWRSSQARAEKMSAVKLNCSLANWLNSPQCQTIKRFRKYLDSPHVNACYSSRIRSWSANSWIVISVLLKKLLFPGWQSTGHHLWHD